VSDLAAVERKLSAIAPVSRETIKRLDVFRQLLERWQARTNLVAPDTLAQFWTRHVADSLQLLPLAPHARLWIDLGSGGGFPGLVIAIALRGTSSRHVLIESSQKKCAFLREVARQTGAEAEIVNGRIESVAQQFAEKSEAEPLITARALAPLPKLLEWSASFLANGGKAIFHKGRDHERELAECRGAWQFDMVRHPSRIEPDSALLEIRNPVRIHV
jgi:16S rRNA (guanine527-N7)-methyltransferase